MKCPSCKEEISESADKKFRPFCSERCRSWTCQIGLTKEMLFLRTYLIQKIEKIHLYLQYLEHHFLVQF